MNKINICSNPALLDVELPSCLGESTSVSTFMPEEEDSDRPLLLLNTNIQGTPALNSFIHPLMPCMDTSNKNIHEDGKGESSSSSGSSYGIGIDIGMNMSENASTTLFNKHTYKHLQNNIKVADDGKNHAFNNGCLTEGKNLPSFVSWNWPLIRKCTFYFFLSSLLAMCAIVAAMLITLPKTCNPKTAWYRGSTFYEVFTASFQDSNNDGIGDLRGLIYRIDYLKSLGVSAVRLNSIFPSPNYPDDYENCTTLTEIARVLGNLNDLRQLSQALHAHNISLILDLPLYPLVKTLNDGDSQNIENDNNNISTFISNNNYNNNNNNRSNNNNSNMTIAMENIIMRSIRFWLDNGIDGFYIKGLEYIEGLNDLRYHLVEWKKLLGSERIIIISENVLKLLTIKQRYDVLSTVDLIDVYLDIFHNSSGLFIKRLKHLLTSELSPNESQVWIHWSFGGVNRPRLTRHQNDSNITLMATIMQLMLPGTPSIFYGDELALRMSNISETLLKEHNEIQHLHHLPIMQWQLTVDEELKQGSLAHQTQHFTNSKTLPWLPNSAAPVSQNFQYIARMINLRHHSPSLYKNAICKAETILSNTIIRQSYNNILIIERFYPRRNSFISITNFSLNQVAMDISSIYYSGLIMLNNTSNDKMYFSHITINPQQTIVVRLDK